MFALVKNCFPEFKFVGLPIKNRDGQFEIYSRASARIRMDDYPYSRNLGLRNGMTWLGDVRANLTGGPSDLSGFPEHLLTVDGSINMKTLATDIKTQCGVQTAVYTTHMANAIRWDYNDNHVSLLVNMIRYAWLAKLDEVSEDRGLRGSLPVYDDGHVTRDNNLWWSADYPIADDVHLDLYSDRDDVIYPQMVRAESYLPADDINMIDLRGMSNRECLGIIACLGAWRRRSRFSLDFSLPRLAAVVGYRREADIPGYTNWLAPEDDVEPVIPHKFSSDEMISILRHYVTLNRLQNQYSVAMTLVCEVAMQMLPDTLESSIWFACHRQITLPHFRALRGRYVLFNEGVAAYIDARSLQDWVWSDVHISRWAMASYILNTACQTGISVRGYRVLGHEEVPDITASETTTLSGWSSYAAYAAEALRREVPLSGMSGIYVQWMVPHDGWFRVRKHLSCHCPEDMRKAYNAVERPPNLGPAPRGHESVVYVTHMALPCMPVLILPLKPMPENSPYELKVSVTIDSSEKTKTGCNIDFARAWNLAWLARYCGYDTITGGVETLGPNRFFASNDNSWTMPLLPSDEARESNIRIRKLVMRDNHFIDIPMIHTRAFSGTLAMELRLVDHKVREYGNDVRGDDIMDVGGGGAIDMLPDIRIEVPEGIRRVRGFISRGELDFRYVDVVIAGVIPRAPEVVIVPGAAVVDEEPLEA